MLKDALDVLHGQNSDGFLANSLRRLIVIYGHRLHVNFPSPRNENKFEQEGPEVGEEIRKLCCLPEVPTFQALLPTHLSHMPRSSLEDMFLNVVKPLELTRLHSGTLRKMSTMHVLCSPTAHTK